MPTCYLNGAFLPLDEARISVLDRGFIFGDGVYEVIPVFNGRPFRLQQHLVRLANSLRAVRIDAPLADAAWPAIIDRLIADNGAGDQSLYVQVTRGVAKRDHVLPAPVRPTVFAMSNALDPGRATEPVSAITCEDIRWKFCDIKAICLLPNVLLRLQAADTGAYEAILVRAGHVTEGAASNVFVVRNGVVKTPPKGTELLPGVTRDLIVEILHARAFPCAETRVTEADLKSADEVWLTSSVREIVPVIAIDQQPVGSGATGPICRQVMDWYQAFKREATG